MGPMSVMFRANAFWVADTVSWGEEYYASMSWSGSTAATDVFPIEVIYSLAWLASQSTWIRSSRSRSGR